MQSSLNETPYKWIPEEQAMLDAESQVIEKIKQNPGFNHSYVKLPIAYKLDFAIVVNNEIKGFCEIKRRSHERNKYPTLILSALKYRELLDWELNFKPACLIVAWSDQLGIHKPSEYHGQQYRIEIGGRSDRNRNGDLEPVVHIPIEHFQRIDQ